MGRFFRAVLVALALFPALFAGRDARADIDYRALLNPQTYKDIDTYYVSADKAAIARIRLKSMAFESRAKKWNIPIPQTLLIRDLTLDVFCRNLTDAELEKLKIKPLFFIAAENFKLILHGKKRTMTITADNALLKKDLSILLTGNVKIGGNAKQMSLGNKVVLRLRGRNIDFQNSTNKKIFSVLL